MKDKKNVSENAENTEITKQKKEKKPHDLKFDKKSIKAHFISKEKPKDAIMYRFRLGFAQNHMFRSKSQTRFEPKGYSGFTVNYSITRDNKATDIARIPSPIMFKINCMDATHADILIFVRPYTNDCEEKEMQELDNTKVKAEVAYKQSMELKMANAADLDLNCLLEYGYKCFIKGLYITNNLPPRSQASSMLEDLKYIENSLIEVKRQP